MPDVTRSDSQKSETSLRPRVSFNRDVHVKRIVSREGGRASGALSGDGAGHLVPSPVRREPLRKSKKELQQEAALVLQKADKLDCITTNAGVPPEKFYTLPRKSRRTDNFTGSLDRKYSGKSDTETESPPKKPPRTFATVTNPQSSQKTSIFDIFKKNDKKQEAKKSNLKRSVSDATNLKSKAYSPKTSSPKSLRKRPGVEVEPESKDKQEKKQLSPIIEDTNRDDYFLTVNVEDKENVASNSNKNHSTTQAPTRKKWKKEEPSITDQLKQYIDEVDEELFKETGIRISPPKEVKKTPEIVIIDVDKAEKISKNKKSRLKNSIFGKKLKSITKKGNDANKNKKASSKLSKQITPIEELQKVVKVENKSSPLPKSSSKQKKPDEKPKPLIPPLSPSPAPRIKEAIESLEGASKRSPTMIHSSQLPVERPPLTKGRAVDSMVKRLSHESASPPPPKTSPLVLPSHSVQHNNNQPFSYTRGLSPDKAHSRETSPGPASPVIYAQVVCGNGTDGPTKQTVHTAYPNTKKYPQHSDSDEGLGYEENCGFLPTSRKFRPERTVTHFGDEHYPLNRNDSLGRGDSFGKSDYLNGSDKFEQESPILPKFRNTGYLNGYSTYEKKYDTNYTKTQHNIFIDSSSRGRGDGMDSKRRESLSEPFENSTPNKTNGSAGKGRSDLSARRDQLESRINRRINDTAIRVSPENAPHSSPTSNLYVSEKTSKYYKSGSTSPIAFTEKYVSESRTDRHNIPRNVESRNKQHYGVSSHHINYNGYDNEPKSFDSQISDYRSSPENRIFEPSHTKSNSKYVSKVEKSKLVKDREYYRSNPEIHHRIIQESKYQESYHDSLRREKHENQINTSKFTSERFLDQTDSERKDKFGDSGIENDFKRESADNYRVPRPREPRRDYCNDSEDEGFASSLLIASERQHTDENIGQRKNRRDYDSDRVHSRDDDPYRHIENMEYRTSRSRQEYIPRERSIDDGSHYDPRIDKDCEKSTLKRVDKKPPKPEKKSGIEKVKQLFSRDSKKKKDKSMVPEESLRARYREYKGSTEHLEPAIKKREANNLQSSYDYNDRKRMPTPSPKPNRESNRNGKSESSQHSSGGWFKSLDRLAARKKSKKEENLTRAEEDSPPKPPATKSLRFFGDTDIESNDSVRQKWKTRTPVGGQRNGDNSPRTRSQSTKDLHNISEERRTPEVASRRNTHKSMQNLHGSASADSDKETRMSRQHLKPPMSPNQGRSSRDRDTLRPATNRRRKNEVSSVESSTEGDSSQQSQRSIVYLHAATVGDIPGPGYLRNGRRAASREELASNSSGRMQPQVKTLSRSFSVLAPWRPRHYKDSMDIDYAQYPKPVKNNKYEQKAAKNGSSRKENSSTLKKKAQESKRSNQSSSTLNRKSRSKENVSSTLRRSREEISSSKGSSSTLYKKKDKLPRENSRYNREDKKLSAKSMSVESLGSRRSKEDNREVSRSVSMPRDPDKSAGWFKMNKKTKTKSGSTQRL